MLDLILSSCEVITGARGTPVKLKTASAVATVLEATQRYWPRVDWTTWESWRESLCLARREMVMSGWVVRRRLGARYQVRLTRPTVRTLQSRVTSSQEEYTVQVDWMVTWGGSRTSRELLQAPLPALLPALQV